MDFIKNKFGLNTFQLKLIAITSMLIDHIGAILLPENLVLRCIGRIAFPIFCFLLTEGFFHTRDIYRYGYRLALFALLSEIPYDLAFRQTIFTLENQNVFFTLLIGFGLLYVLEKSKERPVQVLEILLAMWLTEILHTDYGFRGILLICIFYYLRELTLAKIAAGACWNFLFPGRVQYYGVFSMVPIALYNGKKGPGFKYMFYIFYPLHLLILHLLQLYWK